MKAIELRIGNYIKQPNGVNMVFRISEGEDVNTFPEEEIEPIPLSEEWLLKFNAVCQPWGWVLNGIIIRWNISRKTCKYWIELGNGKRIELPFVHTLQNFFALTGNELTIQP